MRLADWFLWRRGFDPAAEWRGRYRTALGAARILKRRGGLVNHIDLCLQPFGVERTDEPRREDIAVVAAPEGEMGAIVLGKGALSFSPTGLIVRPLRLVPPLVVWRV